jgi:hypothetical protein
MGSAALSQGVGAPSLAHPDEATLLSLSIDLAKREKHTFRFDSAPSVDSEKNKAAGVGGGGWHQRLQQMKNATNKNVSKLSHKNKNRMGSLQVSRVQ